MSRKLQGMVSYSISALQILEIARFDESVLLEEVTVSERASSVVGTSARLRPGDRMR